MRTFTEVGYPECNPERLNKIIVYLLLTSIGAEYVVTGSW